MPVTDKGEWVGDGGLIEVWAVDPDDDMVVMIDGHMACLKTEDRKSLIAWLARYTEMGD